MAESYDIQLTDPQSAAFKVRAFTSNGPVFPTSSTPADTATSASTSLLIYGKGHSNYGERIAENILHIMENFSGSSEPQFPVSGQLWFSRYTLLLTGSGYFEWIDDTADINGGAWVSFIPQTTGGAAPDPVVNSGYWIRTDTNILSYGINDGSHPLDGTWLPRIFDTIPSLGIPLPAQHKPRKVLRVFDGTNWVDTETVYTSETAGEPPTPVEGDLWINTTTGRFNYYTGGSFQSAALESDIAAILADAPYLPLTGGILAGSVDMNLNPLTNLVTLTDTSSPAADDLDAANKIFVNTRIATELSGLGGAIPTNLGDLLDVVDTALPNSYLKFVAGTWSNDTIQLADITDYPTAITPTELSYLDGVTGLLQPQINSKVNNTGDTITGPFIIDVGGSLTIDGTLIINSSVDVNGNFINNLVDPIALQDAATKNYVDNAIGGIVGTDQFVSDGVMYDTAQPTFRLPEENAVVGDLELIYNDGTNVLIQGISPLSHQHNALDIPYTTNEDTLLSDLTIPPADISNAVDQLDQIMVRRTKNRRFVQTATATATFNVVAYEAGADALFIYVDGVKQVSSVSGEQVALFGTGPINSSFTNLLNDATVYTAAVVVDGGASQPISITGSTAQTFKDLIVEINNNITGAVAILDDGEITIVSDLYGAGSSVVITDTDLFATVSGFVGFDAATAGVDYDYEEQAAHGTSAGTIIFNSALIGGEILESIVLGDDTKGLI